jgi:adenosylhomocysteine nucleosidase
MLRIGAVVGLPVEAAILRIRARRSVSAELLSVAGASAPRAEALADELIARGANALLSFGIAGGIAPELRPGALVLASEVIAEDGMRWPVSAAWRGSIRAQLKVHEGTLAGSDRMIATIAEKQRWQTQTGAVAIDMESHGIARAAAKHGVPLLVLRAVADAGDQALPAAATAGLAPDGSTKPFAVLAALLRSPGDIPQLLGVSANTAIALAALWRAAGSLSAP